MIDKKIFIPVFLVFLFILALLILPALDTGKKSNTAQAQPQAAASQTPSVEEAVEETVQTPQPQASKEAQPTAQAGSFMISDSFAEEIENLWPLSYVSAGSFGEPSVNYVDIDKFNNRTYLTYVFESSLDIESATEQYNAALFGSPGSSGNNGFVPSKDGSEIKAVLDISETEHNTLVFISFTLDGQLSIIENLKADNLWLDDIKCPGITENMLMLEGITYSSQQSIILYSIYSASQDIKTQAFEWYRENYLLFPDFSDATEEDTGNVNISFEFEKCRINVCNYLDSMVKITIVE